MNADYKSGYESGFHAGSRVAAVIEAKRKAAGELYEVVRRGIACNAFGVGTHLAASAVAALAEADGETDVPAPDEPLDWTQVLKIEINGKHPRFDRDHTPGITLLLHQIASELNRNGVQLTAYPWEQTEDGAVLFRVNLVETINDAPVAATDGGDVKP